MDADGADARRPRRDASLQCFHGDPSLTGPDPVQLYVDVCLVLGTAIARYIGARRYGTGYARVPVRRT